MKSAFRVDIYTWSKSRNLQGFQMRLDKIIQLFGSQLKLSIKIVNLIFEHSSKGQQYYLDVQDMNFLTVVTIDEFIRIEIRIILYK